MQIQLWREILGPYTLAVDELLVKINHIIGEFRNTGEYSPIEQVDGRVKTISSILAKAQKKQIELTRVEEMVEDIAGIRIICQFVEDINKVVALIKGRTDMRIKSEKDYITTMKPSGYRSYHIVIYYTVQTLSGTKEIQVEIQIRTLAMNFWATIEHSLQYKYQQNIPLHIKNRLSRAADAVIVLDQEMSVVRDEIMDAQSSFKIKANIVADILSNIQNLYKVADKSEIEKIQEEFYLVYESGDDAKLEEFSKKLDLISEGYRAQSLG